jgi:hypothetical protein
VVHGCALNWMCPLFFFLFFGELGQYFSVTSKDLFKTDKIQISFFLLSKCKLSCHDRWLCLQTVEFLISPNLVLYLNTVFLFQQPGMMHSKVFFCHCKVWFQFRVFWISQQGLYRVCQGSIEHAFVLRDVMAGSHFAAEGPWTCVCSSTIIPGLTNWALAGCSPLKILSGVLC